MVRALKIEYTTNGMRGERIPSYIVYVPEHDIGIQMVGKKGDPILGNAGEYFDFVRSMVNSRNGGLKPVEMEVSERYVGLINRIYQMRMQRLTKEGVLAA